METPSAFQGGSKTGVLHMWPDTGVPCCALPCPFDSCEIENFAETNVCTVVLVLGVSRRSRVLHGASSYQGHSAVRRLPLELQQKLIAGSEG